MRPILILAALALAPLAALADEGPEGWTCEETWKDVLDGGTDRVVVGSVMMGAGAAGAAVGLGLLMRNAADAHSDPEGWTALEQEWDMLLMMPAMLGAATIASGFIITTIGAGMRSDALRLASRSGAPLDQFCYPAWKAQHEHGRRHVLVGSVFIVAGLELFAIGLGTDINTRLHPDPEFSSWGIGILNAIFGALGVTAGIVLVLKGTRIMERALRERSGAIAPAPRVRLALSPTGLALAW
jgi:hypothetical protein